jgi:hypothetical protein
MVTNRFKDSLLPRWARLVRRALEAGRGRHPRGRLSLALRAVWAGGPVPPAGAARDLVAHVSSGR